MGFPVVSDWYVKSLPGNLRAGARFDGRTARLVIRTIDDHTVTLFAREDIYGENDDMRWMTAEDFPRAISLLESRQFEPAKLHAVYATAKGHALIDGFTSEEATIIAGWSFDAFKGVQLQAKQGFTLDTLRRDSLNFAVRYNVGQWHSAIGPLVTLIPVYGQVIGGAMMLVGGVLTATQMNEVMRKASLTKKRELIAARTAFMRGEITKEEYFTLQHEILQGVGEQMLADGEFGRMTLPYEDFVGVQPALLDRIGMFVSSIIADPVATALVLGVGLTAAGAIWQISMWNGSRTT